MAIRSRPSPGQTKWACRKGPEVMHQFELRKHLNRYKQKPSYGRSLEHLSSFYSPGIFPFIGFRLFYLLFRKGRGWMKVARTSKKYAK